jgi:SAM-dependent methyltransferase
MKFPKKYPIFNTKSVFNAKNYLYWYKDHLNKVRTETEVFFVKEKLELNSNCRLLDLACGYGRHTNYFVKICKSVVGIDVIEDFLSIAKNNTGEKHKSKIKYINQDIRKINYKEEFDKITLLFTAFGYFSHNQNVKLLKTIYKALSLDGVFIFDGLNKKVINKWMKEITITEKQNNLLIERNKFDKETGLLINKRIMIMNKKRIDAPYFFQTYSGNELKLILKKIGFKKIEIYSGFDGKKYSELKSPRWVIVAKK